jgi:hypothetical protein
MNLSLEVVSVTVLCRRFHTDRIYIKFLGPAAFPGADPGEIPSLQMEVAKGTGLQYARMVFGIEPEVIQCEG